MQTENFQLVLSDDADSRDNWRHTTSSVYGLQCEFTPGGSAGSSSSSWHLGPLEFLSVDLAHQSLTPIAERSDPYLYLKLIETGSMVIDQGQQVLRFEAGSMVLVDSAKSYRQIFAECTQMIAVRIPKGGLKERGFRHDLRGPFAPDIAMSDVRAIGDFIRAVARQNGATSSNMRRRQGDQLLDVLDILIEDPSALIRARSSDATLFRAKRFIARNLRNADLTAALIASAASASEAHLNRLFKIEGSSLMRYVWSCRLELAANLVRRCVESPIQIREIAYRCGFSTPAHFSRAFKARYGLTPRDALFRNGKTERRNASGRQMTDAGQSCASGGLLSMPRPL